VREGLISFGYDVLLPEMPARPRSFREAELRIALPPKGCFGDKIAYLDKVRFRLSG